MKVLYFYSNDSIPCRNFSEIEVMKVLPLFSNVQLISVDTNIFPTVVRDYEIDTLPTILIQSNDGGTIERLSGIIKKADLTEAIRHAKRLTA